MKYLLFSLLVLFGAISAANAVQMPSAKILTERLKALHLDHFMEKTSIVNNLADKELYVGGVAVAVDLAMYDYCQTVSNPIICTGVHMLKPMIYESILQDHPDALRELEERF